MKIPVFLLAFQLFAATATAQDLKWGKIPDEDLSMKIYAADSLAAAVVLGEEGEFNFYATENRLFYKQKTHRRIKILSKAGLGEGNIALAFYSKGGHEKISGVDAQVFLPNGERIKMKDSDVFEEKIDDEYSRVRFAVPGLQVGAVMEFRYTLQSDNLTMPRQWRFDDDIPVRRSVYKFRSPVAYIYGYLLTGQRYVRITQNIAHEEYVGAQFYTKIAEVEFTAETMPAIQPEPYISCLGNHIVNVQMQLDKVVDRNGGEEPVLGTWPKFAEELLEHKHLGLQLSKEKLHEKAWAEVAKNTLAAKTPSEKAEAIYRFLNEKMDWNNELRLFVDKDLDEIFEKGKGNSAELNLLLIACLRRSGIDADPVLVSTRSNGWASQLYPLVHQFNHIIAAAQLDGKQVFMDLGNPHRPYNLIRGEALNNDGFLLKKQAAAWIKIEAPTDVVSGLIVAKLDESGSVGGKLEISYSNYAAVEWRSWAAEDKDFSKLNEHFSKKHADIQTDSIEFVPVPNNRESLLERFNFSVPNHAQVVGDMIYVTPLFLTIFEENPFKNEKRVLPVEFMNPKKFNMAFNLDLPDGYEVAALPESVNYSMGEALKFKMVVGKQGKQVQVILRVNLNRLYFEPDEYASVRHFYELVIAKQTEPIVLKKI